MIRIGIDPNIITLGAFSLTWHSLFSVVAIAVGVWLTMRRSRGRGFPEDTTYGLLLWAVLGGMVGARLLHVLDYWDDFAANPISIFALWEGGVAIWGGILGGLLAALLYSKIKGISFSPYADLAAPGLILAQAIGRIGDVINGEHFSIATSLPWGVVYTHANSPAYEMPAQHPAVAYELLMDLLIFAILWKLRGRVRREGNLFLVYLVSYSTGRFFLSFLRLDSHTVFMGLNQAHWVSLSVLVAALIAVVYRHFARRSAEASGGP